MISFFKETKVSLAIVLNYEHNVQCHPNAMSIWCLRLTHL